MCKFSFLARTSLLVGFFFGIDKVLAFARSIIIARTFNLSSELDAFNALVPNVPTLLLRPVRIVGAVLTRPRNASPCAFTI